ncbi:hypothetical protein [Ruegeria atlantica]|uniref:hypothetical protein n=1 Tax=Ruegeria atlantica TaxID=81569 RepID=UPI002495A814|nr:hypothetical protein [Ruegeria atlantica]
MRPVDKHSPPSAEEILQLTRLDPIPSYLSPSLYLPVFEALVELRLKGIDADWNVVLDSGWRCLGLAHAALLLHQDHTATLRRSLALQQLSDDFTDLALEDSFNDRNRAELIAELQAAGEEIDPLAGIDVLMAEIEADPHFADLSGEFDDIRSELEQIHTSTFEETSALLDQETGGPLLDEIVGLRQKAMQTLVEGDAMILTGLSRGLVAVAHAGFNLTERSDTVISAFVATDYLPAANRLIDRFAKQLRGLQMELFVACARNALDEAAQAALNIVVESERALPAFLRSQAILRYSIAELQNLGRNSESEALGRQAARAGGLTREAIGSHAAAARIMQEIASGFRAETVAELVERASSTAFDGDLPDGKNTALNALSDRPDGEFVEVEGFVNTIEVLNPPGKSRVSRVGLIDPSNGATFPAVVLFAHLPHAGLTEGAYVRLNGTIQSSSDLNEDEPAVEIDRLALAELAKENWRIAFLRTAEPWYEVWRSNANMIWSIGPHLPQDEQEPIALGAADLIYPPFVRD